jgi:hypothetical protein
MSVSAQWQNLAGALRELHRALMERARRDYEHENGVVLNPGRFLQLLTTDPYFEWLRGLSELMVDIDVVHDAKSELIDEMASAVRAAVEHLIAAPKPPVSTHAFAEHYWPYVQDDPHVAMAHGGVKRALEPFPRLENADAARLLHERHRLAEKARHSKRGK